MIILQKLLGKVSEDYENKLYNFKDIEFIKFYDLNVNKFISNPEIFEWLGILDIEYVYEMYLTGNKNRNEERKEHEIQQEEDNFRIDDERDNYTETFDELKEAGRH